MKNFLVFLFTLFIAILYISQQDLFLKTRTGAKIEQFKSVSEPQDMLPGILITYLRDNSIRYKYNKIPNYIKDFLSANIDYEVVYKNPTKYTALFFIPVKTSDKNLSGFKLLYDKYVKERKLYGDKFLLIYKHDLSEKVIYKNPYDEKAFTDLKAYCNAFCLINPSNDTIFSFKNTSNTEAEALEILLQQYDLMSK